MRHLYNSTGHIERLSRTMVNGAARTSWSIIPVDDPDAVLRSFKLRLDLNFLRPGKDVLPPMEAGKAQDRIGIMFCDVLPIRAGDRLVVDAGPVLGTFDIRNMPDVPITLRPVGHHMEIQVVEVSQNLPRPT